MAERTWFARTSGKMQDLGVGNVVPLAPTLWGLGHQEPPWFTENEELLFNLPRTVTLRGIAVDTEVTVVRNSDDVEITSMHVEDAVADQVLNYTFTGEVISVRILLHKPGLTWQKITPVSLGQNSLEIPVSQRIARWFYNPPG